jgi:hypothetical protein
MTEAFGMKHPGFVAGGVERDFTILDVEDVFDAGDQKQTPDGCRTRATTSSPWYLRRGEPGVRSRWAYPLGRRRRPIPGL